MTLWDKVSSASPYLNDIRSGIDEGPVRVWFVKSVSSLQILAVVVFILISSWLTCRCDDQDIFFRSIRQQGLVFSTLCYDGEELQACVPWRVPPTDILSMGTRSRYQQRVAFTVFKAMFGEDVCRCFFSLPSIQCNFQALANSG